MASKSARSSTLPGSVADHANVPAGKNPIHQIARHFGQSDSDSAQSIARRIAQAVESLIEQGELALGQRLPTHKQLAAALEVHYLTVRQSYQQLAEAGFIQQHRGRGTFVASSLPVRGSVVVAIPSWDEVASTPWNSYVYQQFLGGIEKTLRQHRFGVRVLGMGRTDLEQRLEMWADHLHQQHDVLICGPMHWHPLVERLVEKGMPVVRYYRAVPGEAVSLALFDRQAAFQRAATHLLKLGRTRIGLLGREESDAHASLAFRGYLDALMAHNVPLDPRLVIRPDARCDGSPTGLKEHEVLAALEQALDQGRVGDALLTDVSHIGQQIVEVLTRRGYRVPEDVAVVSFDEVPPAAGSSGQPSMTWLNIPRWQIGENAALIALDLLAGRCKPGEQRICQSQLILGQTCGSRSLQTVLPTDVDPISV